MFEKLKFTTRPGGAEIADGFLYPCTLVFALHSPTPTPWSYTRNQRLGLLCLLLLLVASYGLRRYIQQRTPTYSSSLSDSTLLQQARLLRQTTAPRSEESVHKTYERFAFNPNTVSLKDLERLGLSHKQATALHRYRERAPFRQADDLRKLRVLHPDQADRLVPLVRLPESDRPANFTASTRTDDPAQPAERFAFDPNTVSLDSLRRLGFTQREASALVKYRSYRPITFKRPRDLFRVRALDSARVQEVLPLVTLPAQSPPTEPVKRPEPLDINAATLDAWQTLPGIGPYRAQQIVTYREKLGGFAAVEQVAETYRLPDSVFVAIAPYLTKVTPPNPLYINRLDAPGLGRHPYLKYRTAAIIVRYREQHGAFAGPEDLQNVRALSAETRNRLLPYLNFDR